MAREYLSQMRAKAEEKKAKKEMEIEEGVKAAEINRAKMDEEGR